VPTYTITIFRAGEFGELESVPLNYPILDVFTMCFILTMNYTMKISLHQQESFVIRVGLSL